MPISTSTNKVKYDCDGSTTTFPFTFAISELGDIVVYLMDSDGAVTTLTVDVDYTVSSSDYMAGGNVETTTAYASGNTLIVFRSPSKVQSTDWVDGDALPAASIEDAVDKLTMQVQELYDIVGRCLRVPPSDDSIPDLPSAANRASKYVACDSEGDPTLTSVIEEGEVSISAFAETLLDDANAAAARTTLGEYDLIIDSNEDLALLENGAGGTYARVLVKAGTYTTAINLDLDDHNVQLFEGETDGTQITFSSSTGDKITMGIISTVRKFKLYSSGANSGTDFMINGNQGSRAFVEDVWHGSTNATPISGIIQVYGGIRNCYAHELKYGYYDCYNLSHCKAMGCYTAGYYACKRLTGCWSDTVEESTSLKHFSGCEYLTGCLAQRGAFEGTDQGFYDCDYLSGCKADAVGDDGFDTCNYIASCEAHAVNADGFSGCASLTSCFANDCIDDGFNSCSRLSACIAFSCGGSGYKSCSNMTACNSSDNTAADTDNAEPILTKIVGFTAWNMDTTATLAVAHGCTLADIRRVTVKLFNNAGTAVYECPTPSTDDLALDLSMTSIGATNVNLRRRASPGIFDAAGFNAAYGYLLIDYIAAGQ